MIISTVEEAIEVFNQDCVFSDDLIPSVVKKIFDKIIGSTNDEHDPEKIITQIEDVSEKDILATFIYFSNPRVKILKMKTKCKINETYEEVKLIGNNKDDVVFIHPVTQEPIPEEKVFLFFYSGENMKNIRQNINP